MDNQPDSSAGQSTRFQYWTINQIPVLDNQLDSSAGRPDSGAGQSTRFWCWTINQIPVLDNQPDSGAGQSTGFWCWTINWIPVLDNQLDSSAGQSTGFRCWIINQCWESTQRSSADMGPRDPTDAEKSNQRSSAGKGMTGAIFWSYRVNLLRLWEVENCLGRGNQFCPGFSV